MKKNIIFFVLITGAIITGCDSTNRKENTVIETDSSMIGKDNTQAIMAGDNTPSATTATASDSGASVKKSVGKPDLLKKSKK